ncbi:MAG TPA: hypothetical protein VF407_00850 [Polyangiaceae bacterium]
MCRSSSRFGLPTLIFCGFLLLSGCGRKATQADCQLIIDRNVEVQMKAMHIDNADMIAKKQEELRTQFKDGMKDCEGKRVTDKMMSCIGSAQTGDEITECLR